MEPPQEPWTHLRDKACFQCKQAFIPKRFRRSRKPRPKDNNYIEAFLTMGEKDHLKTITLPLHKPCLDDFISQYTNYLQRELQVPAPEIPDSFPWDKDNHYTLVRLSTCNSQGIPSEDLTKAQRRTRSLIRRYIKKNIEKAFFTECEQRDFFSHYESECSGDKWDYIKSVHEVPYLKFKDSFQYKGCTLPANKYLFRIGPFGSFK